MKLSSTITLNKRASVLFIPLLLLISFSSNAQNATSSPYSRYGIGDITGTTFARNLGMGGLEIGMAQPFMINPGNPAAYSKIWYTTFDGGVNYSQTELSSLSVKQNTNTISLAYFDFAFPVIPDNWAVGFGLKPFSKVGYSIQENSTTPFGDDEIRTYKGSGGLNSFHMGTGKKFGKKLSVGFDIEYLFGVINKNRTIEYRTPYYMNTLDNSSTSIGWFHFKFGLQYAFDSLKLAKSDSLVMYDKQIQMLTDSLSNLIGTDASAGSYDVKNSINQEIAQATDLRSKVVNRKKKSDWNLLLGITGSPSADLNARATRTVSSFRYFNVSAANQVLIRDTALYSYGDQKKVTLPMSVGFGFTLKKGSKWLFGADYSMQQWSDFKFLDATDSLVDTWKVAVGVQLTPNDRALRGYGNFVSYRAGFHYEQTYLNVGTENIKDMGVSIGFGLPIRRAGTHLHISAEAGQRGKVSANPIQEKYFKLTVGFTINDRWFVKQKYD
ncbi:MAG: hypothetical protein ACO1G6_10065 [Bacteroidota bacterium]